LQVLRITPIPRVFISALIVSYFRPKCTPSTGPNEQSWF
jgi:hypothetical protein